MKTLLTIAAIATFILAGAAAAQEAGPDTATASAGVNDGENGGPRQEAGPKTATASAEVDDGGDGPGPHQAGPAVSTEFSFAVQAFSPGQDEDYDSGFGVEFQHRFWKPPGVGMALAVGVAVWDTYDQFAVVSDGRATASASMEGFVYLVPIGGSVLVRSALGENVSLIFEGGVRYVVVESYVEVAYAAATASGIAVVGTGYIEIDDGIVGLVAANLEAELSPGFRLFCGVGYQFDIEKGKAKWMGEDLGDNELKAFFASAGMALAF